MLPFSSLNLKSDLNSLDKRLPGSDPANILDFMHLYIKRLHINFASYNGHYVREKIGKKKTCSHGSRQGVVERGKMKLGIREEFLTVLIIP